MFTARNTFAIVGALSLVLGLTGCGSEGSTPPESRTPDSFAMASSIVGDSYQVYVAVPENYAGEGRSRYPAVYLLDANWNFEGVRGYITSLVSQGEMVPVILVAVCPVQALQTGYGGTAPARCRDLTPTAVAGFPGSGNARGFAGFLRDELIPRIDATYRTRPVPDDRCLVGHSLAGLFTWYAALSLNDTFHKFIPASASLYWDDHVLFDDELAYSRDHADLPAIVYSTVSTGEGPEMVADRDELVNRLRSRLYPGLRIHTATYVGIEHNSSSRPAFQEGLALLF